jgi:hypothetical protein
MCEILGQLWYDWHEFTLICDRYFSRYVTSAGLRMLAFMLRNSVTDRLLSHKYFNHVEIKGFAIKWS